MYPVTFHNDQLKNLINYKIYRLLRTSLIFFYGHFFTNAVYTNLIHVIPSIQMNPVDYYSFVKLTLGLLMFVQTIFSVVVIWLKVWKLIFAGAWTLIIVSIGCLVIEIIDLTDKAAYQTNIGSSVTQIIVEVFLRLLAIGATFCIVKFLRDIYNKLDSSIQLIE